MAACRTLDEYSQFVQVIRDNSKTMPVEDAVRKAVDDCIRVGILRDFLLKHKAEATNMSIYEYDAEQHERFLREEGYEEGRKEGREESLSMFVRKLAEHYVRTGVAEDLPAGIKMAEEILKAD